MIVALSGKGGVGKTTLAALLLDEVARRRFSGPVLAVDGDPAATLHLALGLAEPRQTISGLRETTVLDAKTIRNLPPGMTPAGYVSDRLQTAGVLASHRLRQMRLDLISLGQGEGAGCYCRINQALSTVLQGLVAQYPLVLIDNEAGLEHLSRYRLKRADHFLVVTTPDQAAQGVAHRILETATQLELEIGYSWLLYNQAPSHFQAPPRRMSITLPRSWSVTRLERLWLPVVQLAPDEGIRRALKPIVERLLPCV